MSRCTKCKHYTNVNFGSMVGDVCQTRSDLPRFFNGTVYNCKYYKKAYFKHFDLSVALIVVFAVGLVALLLFSK